MEILKKKKSEVFTVLGFYGFQRPIFCEIVLSGGGKEETEAKGEGRRKGRGNTYKYVFIYPNPSVQTTTHTFPILTIILKLVQIL